MPFLHGSEGCATYMRRYIISHYREPMDIASSSLGEKQAVYGGAPNLKQGLGNVMNKYRALLIGVATTCLTETIGDDVPGIVREFCQETTGENPGLPEIVTVFTPSYAGTHMEGFHAAVKGLVEQLAEAGEPTRAVTLPGFVSPADIRYLKEILEDFGLDGIILPDLSDTLDGPAQLEPRPWAPWESRRLSLMAVRPWWVSAGCLKKSPAKPTGCSGMNRPAHSAISMNRSFKPWSGSEPDGEIPQ